MWYTCGLLALPLTILVGGPPPHLSRSKTMLSPTVGSYALSQSGDSISDSVILPMSSFATAQPVPSALRAIRRIWSSSPGNALMSSRRLDLWT